MSNPSAVLSPPVSGSHRRTQSNTSGEDSDDDSSPVADINSHLSSSVKDRMNFWRTNEKSSPAVQPVHSRQPSAAAPRMPPSISRTERVEESKERESVADAAKAAKEAEEESKRDKKAGVREAYLQRLQRHQAERTEEQRRRHDAEVNGELDSTKHAKHRAQESLQLKITVEKDSSAPASRRASPANPATHAPSTAVPSIKPSTGDATYTPSAAPSVAVPATAQAKAPAPAQNAHGPVQKQPSPTFSATHPPASPPTASYSPASFDLDTPSFSVSPMTPPVPPPRPPPLLSLKSSHTVGLHQHSLSQVLPPPVPDHARARSCTTPTSSPSPPPSASPTTASPSPIESPPSQSPRTPLSSSSPPAAATPAPSFPAGTNDPAHRKLVVGEIISSEQSYVSSLSTLISVYLHPLKGKDGGDILAAPDVGVLFGGVELLYNFHMIFLDDLKASDGSVARVILKLCDFLKMYSKYLENYPSAITSFDAQRKNKPFHAFLCEARKKTTAAGQPVLDLMSYLIMPVQRVPRYELLLRELMRYTPGVHEEREVLEKALSKIQSIAQHINESGRRVEEMQRVMDVQARISGEYGTLLLPHRRLVREGTVQKMKGDKSSTGGGGVLGGGGGRRLFVFNDLIIWTSESGRFRGHTRVDGMKVEAWTDSSKGRAGFVLREDDSDGDAEAAGSGAARKKGAKEMVFVCASEAESEQWRAAISDVCQKAQQQRRSSTLAAAPGHRSERSVSINQAAGPASSAAPIAQRTLRNRGSGRSTHKQLMQSLTQLKGRVGESRVGRGEGEEEEDEDVSRVRRRGSFNSVSMSVSPFMPPEDE